ncbi:MAG: hypothetical protein R2792_19925 [Saprospiraceae bacterium]
MASSDYLHIHPVVLAGFAVLGFLPLRSRFLDRDKYPKLSFSWLAFLGLLVLSLICNCTAAWILPCHLHKPECCFCFQQGILWAVWKKHWSMMCICVCSPAGYCLVQRDRAGGITCRFCFFYSLAYSRLGTEYGAVEQERVANGETGVFLCSLCILVFVSLFRYAYSFVYRDGLRSEMRAELGAVYPKLSGIISNKNTFDLYRDLRDLQALYPNSIVLPHFPLADYLADKTPVLPLDWVVKREMGGQEALVYNQLLENKPVILIETSWLTDIETEPEYDLVREVIAQYNKMEQTAYFTVYKMNDE